MWGMRATTAAPVRFQWPPDSLHDALEISPPMLSTGTRSFTGERSVVFGNQASMDAGLEYRSLVESAMATLEWRRSQPQERRAEPRGWIPDDTEREAVARLRS